MEMEEFKLWKDHVQSQELYLKHYQLVCSASVVILMQLGFTFLEVSDSGEGSGGGGQMAIPVKHRVWGRYNIHIFFLKQFEEFVAFSLLRVITIC